MFQPPPGWYQRELNTFLVQQIKFMIDRNPWSNVLMFSLLPFKPAPGFVMPKLGHTGPLRPDHVDFTNPSTYAMFETMEGYEAQKGLPDVYYFTLGGNHCREAWHQTLLLNDFSINPPMDARVFVGLTRQEAQVVSLYVFALCCVVYLCGTFFFVRFRSAESPTMCGTWA